MAMSSALEPFDADGSAGAEFGKGGSFARRVFRLALAQRSGLKWIFLAGLAEALFNLAGPWLSARVIDTALPDRASSTLFIVIVLVIAAALQVACAGWLRQSIMAALCSRVEGEALTLVMERIVNTEFLLSRQRDFGSTQETVDAVSAATSTLIRAFAGVVTQLLTVLCTLAFLGVWFPTLAGLVMLWAAAMLAAGGAYAVKEAGLASKALETSSRQRQTLHVLLRGIATLRMSGATDREMNRWKRELVDNTHAAVAQESAHVAQGVVFQAFPQLIQVAATAWFVYDVVAGRATLGDMMMGTMLVSAAIGACVALANSAVRFRAMRPHFKRVDELLEASESRTSAPSDNLRHHSVSEGLLLSNVWFRYQPGGRWVLERHNSSFPTNRVTELRARSGAGKTTILRLLAGLIAPEHGSVRVLGHDPRSKTDLVAYLPQQSMLLEASIAQNLTVLSGRPLLESLLVAEHTGLLELLARLPMKAETIVSMGGTNLSAGQRQLILLTAAFASGRPVVLLDESTSQLDAESRSKINWNALTQGKTVVVVSHD